MIPSTQPNLLFESFFPMITMTYYGDGTSGYQEQIPCFRPTQLFFFEEGGGESFMMIPY